MYCKLNSTPVQTNEAQSNYRPHFIDLTQFKLSKVEFESIFFNSGSAESELVTGNYSFAYLKSDKLRTIKGFDPSGQMISFENFLNRLNITVRSTNLFKSGKYLSRLFRSTRYGSWFTGLNIHINENPAYVGKITDGISLISLGLAREMGWSNVKAGMSAQITLAWEKGLVKGHCVISDKIKHDAVVFGLANIKAELSIGLGLQYIALEPLKLGRTLRMDIQTLINLWDLFGPEQYLRWAHEGIEAYKRDLFNGRLIDWLDTDDISEEENGKEKWILRKAIVRGIDYTKYPGLIRSGWSMFKSSMLRFAADENNRPVFRIPVPGGLRGYLRVDLRNHDADGNFYSSLKEDEICLDHFSNLWVSPVNIENFLLTLNGADQDDSCGIIPVDDGKAVLYRNPNAFGEFHVKKIVYEGISTSTENNIVGQLQPKKVEPKVELSKPFATTGNSLLDSFLMGLSESKENLIHYSRANLLKAYVKVSQNNTSIGLAANAEMIRAAIRINSIHDFEALAEDHIFDLEKVIDSQVKDGVDAREDMQAVNDLLIAVCEAKLEVPKVLIGRFPESLRPEVKPADNHICDHLLQAIEYLVRRADKEVLGSGSASKGTRIPGLIDKVETPLIEMAVSSIDNPMYDVAMDLMKGYYRSVAIMLEKTKDMTMFQAEVERKHGMEKIQRELLTKITVFDNTQRAQIVNVWGYEIYKSVRSPHDSILWIKNIDGLRGTGEDMIEMLTHLSLGKEIKRIPLPAAKILPQIVPTSIRIWHSSVKSGELNFTNSLKVEGGKAIIGLLRFHIGDECHIPSGHYSIKSIVPSLSRKDGQLLKNSLTVYLTD